MQTLIIGCGYLGLRVAALWRSRGHRVLALTRSDQNAVMLKSLGIEPIVGDVLSPSTLHSLPSADVVLYAVGYDKHSGAGKRAVYVDGLHNVLEQIAPRIGRLLYVSSTSVYGQDDGEMVDETSTCVPGTEAGQIALAAEQTVWRFFSESSGPAGLARPCLAMAKSEENRANLPVRSNEPERGAIVLRFSGLYGPGRLLRRIESVRSGDPIRANPEGFLNLIHVDDGARVVSGLAQRGRLGAVYLVTDDRPVRRREYYTRLAELVGAPPPVFEADENGCGLNKRCSNARLRAKLDDVLCFSTFETGLADAVTSGSAIPYR